MSTWLVTGGAGYIGAHVARALTAASPTRSWLSWPVMSRQPPWSSPTSASFGTRTSS